MIAYLAGPEVFLANAVEVGEKKKALCRRYGIEGLYPLDSGADVSGEDQTLIALRISQANEAMIRRSDILIANMTPFRGPSADVGTAYEMGFARGLGLPVLAYTNSDPDQRFSKRTLAFLGDKAKPAMTFGVPGFVDEQDMAVESFGLWDNLMLDGAVMASGFQVIQETSYNWRLFLNLIGFQRCLEEAVRRLKA